MGFLSKMLGKEQRSVRTSDPYLAEFFGLGGTPVVTPETALSNSSVAMRCVTLRSELLASVGLHMFRRSTDGGRDRAADNPLYGVLHDNFNPQLSAYEGREFLIRCLDLHGNAYLLIERNNKGQVTALYPLLPGTVTVERLKSGRLRYKVMQPNGGTEVYLQEEILHIRGPSRDGIVGQSPIQVARGTLGLTLALSDTQTGLMNNALRPSGVLSFENSLSKDGLDSVKNAIVEGWAGGKNAGRVMVLDNSAKYQQMSMSAEDAQLLESRKLANEDVARIFGVPPTAVGILDRGTYSNVEQEATSLIQNCLGPLASRIEAAMMRCLLTEESRKTLYIEHDLSGLLRGDVKSRYDAYRMAREMGVYSANDVRRRENEPPIKGGDDYHQPANWVPLGTVPKQGGA